MQILRHETIGALCQRGLDDEAVPDRDARIDAAANGLMDAFRGRYGDREGTELVDGEERRRPAGNPDGRFVVNSPYQIESSSGAAQELPKVQLDRVEGRNASAALGPFL